MTPLTSSEIDNLINYIDEFTKKYSLTSIKLTGLYLSEELKFILDFLGYDTKYDSNNSFFIYCRV